MNSERSERKSLLLNWRPNRSLSPRGRSLWFGLIALATSLLAVGAVALGAWMVLPFAGGELLLVWLAFNVIGRHDKDYEVLQISDQDLSWERSDRGCLSSLQGNRAWVQVVGEPVVGRFELCLRYAGKHVATASLLSDVQRRLMARELLQILGSR